MAKKIEGYTAHNPENLKGAETYFEFFEEDFAVSGPWERATLVIGDERVFTESEVVAMALEAIKLIQRDMPQSPEHVGRAGGAIAKVLNGHGIVLDPA